MEKGRTGLTFCAEFPNDTQARKFAEELVNRFSEIRKLRGGSLVFVDEQGNTLCEVAVLREHKLKKKSARPWSSAIVEKNTVPRHFAQVGFG
jgi:hypothetical protein